MNIFDLKAISCRNRNSYPRTIIYCLKNVQTCIEQEFHTQCCSVIIEVQKMFTSCTDEVVTKQIIISFTTLHIVCTTIAVGMGADCLNVWVVMHVGPSDE